MWHKKIPSGGRRKSTANPRSSASQSPKGAWWHDIYTVSCGGAIRARKWLAFLRNHREAIVGLDLFTVPTAAFRVLYCHFVIEHGRRRIHFNVTRHLSADRAVQRLREAFPEADPYRYAILDRDSIFDADVIVLKGHRSRAEADGPPVAKGRMTA